MVIGILQFDLIIHAAESLKDKRRVVRSVKDKLHRDFQCAVAEVGALDSLAVARMGLAIVSNDGRHAGQVLDHITERLRELPDAHLGDCRRELITGRGGEEDPDADSNSDGLVDASVSPLRRSMDDELIRRAMQDPELASLAAAEARTILPTTVGPGSRAGRSGVNPPRNTPEARP